MRMLLENPSTYVQFSDSAIAETEFLAEVVRRTGCGLLLDVNNVFVSATNHGFDPFAYLAAFPLRHVGEIHLAGYADATDDEGAPLLIDAHNSPVRDGVWALYQETIGRLGPTPTLIEWDNDVPQWPVLARRGAPRRRGDGAQRQRQGVAPCRLRRRSPASRARWSTRRGPRPRRRNGATGDRSSAASPSTATMSRSR